MDLRPPARVTELLDAYASTLIDVLFEGNTVTIAPDGVGGPEVRQVSAEDRRGACVG